jgi:serine/threonine protein kinase
MAMDVAAGMTYLCGHNIVHRDLACRNLLVCSVLFFSTEYPISFLADNPPQVKEEGGKTMIKISDFGLSRVGPKVSESSNA